ncbi:DNA polymerase I [Parvularcula dongshanensis]|uniref:DNA polymerase I n=1 Tax=Parvularcula dongshanensis TaxID=1173995 RepID=A0A840HZP3_9PROT|nr:DNA polymerase I [Parvularcula dongshanensis]MBB4658049.1 DNA polymerase-1 [Parvularcula dongshanensis]
MPQTSPLGPESRLYLVDGSAYIFRAYHGMSAAQTLTRKSDGLPVGAISVFCNMLWKLLADAQNEAVEHMGTPTHFAVVFDKSSYTFRNDLYPDYKANRSETPSDLLLQVPYIKEATRAFGLPCLEQEGYEADDIMATHSRLAEERGAETIIVSSDKDLTQLVTPLTVMYDPMKDKLIGEAEVRERYGVEPSQMIELQALMGDTSDNVPGVPGIGPKTAAQLLAEFGTLDALLERTSEIKQNKRRETLETHASDARLSRDLVTLKRDVPVPEHPDEFGLEPFDHSKLVAFLEEMEFNTLTRRVRDKGGLAAPAPKAATAEDTEIKTDAYETITTMAALEAIIAEAVESGVLAVDTETDSLNAMRARLVGVCLSPRPGRAAYVPLLHGGGGLDLAGEAEVTQLKTDDVLDALRPVLTDPSVLKIGQNLKYDLVVLSAHDVEVTPYDDTMLMSYVAECGLGGHGMDELSERHLGHKTIPFSEVAGTGRNKRTFDEVPIKEATAYAAEDADVTLRLHQNLKRRLVQDGLVTVYETIERPLVPVIRDMETAGVKVDRAALSRLSGDFAQRMAQHEEAAYEAAGERFNIGSPKQIGDILFGKMGLPGGKKTKTGAWQTGADLLDELAAQGVTVAAEILTWRQLSKLKSTYTDALVAAIHPDTGRVHTSFSLAQTLTGRLSSSDPNLQNIPIRTEEGRKIRNAFVAEEGNVILAADYSQIELRLLAHIADIPELKRAFKEGTDVHALTASEMFETPIDQVSGDQRRSAKMINFGIIYGISAFGLSNRLGIERERAAEYIKGYFAKFPGIRAYMDETLRGAREKGYVTTLFGRRSHMPNINSKQQNFRAFAERQAINAPIQGTAADVVKRAMIRMPEALRKEGLRAKMLLQVHDELVFECPAEEADRTAEIVRQVMEGAPLPVMQLAVPLLVEANAADNWEAAH